jgi:hypothetical protein
MVTVVAAAAYQLHRQGRLWWCACGYLWLWSGDAWGSHNSQHLFDPYTFTHVLHGIVLCGLLAWCLPRLSPPWRFCLAVSIEALWEVFENSAFIIERYRAATISLGYQGDTIVNSLGDILAFGVGYALARRLGFKNSLVLFVAIEVVLLIWIVLFVAIEVVLLIWIRDSLLLNIVMLIHPIDAIKAWQLSH